MTLCKKEAKLTIIVFVEQEIRPGSYIVAEDLPRFLCPYTAPSLYHNSLCNDDTSFLVKIFVYTKKQTIYY